MTTEEVKLEARFAVCVDVFNDKGAQVDVKTTLFPDAAKYIEHLRSLSKGEKKKRRPGEQLLSLVVRVYEADVPVSVAGFSVLNVPVSAKF